MITKLELANLWKTSERTIERYLLDGLPHEGSRLTLRFDPAAAEAWRANRRSRKPKRPLATMARSAPPPDAVDIRAAEFQKVLAEAQFKQLKVQALRGQLLDRERVHDAASAAFKNVQLRMRAIPKALAARLAATDVPAEVEEVLATAIDGALDELSLEVFKSAI